MWIHTSTKSGTVKLILEKKQMKHRSSRLLTVGPDIIETSVCTVRSIEDCSVKDVPKCGKRSVEISLPSHSITKNIYTYLFPSSYSVGATACRTFMRYCNPRQKAIQTIDEDSLESRYQIRD